MMTNKTQSCPNRAFLLLYSYCLTIQQACEDNSPSPVTAVAVREPGTTQRSAKCQLAESCTCTAYALPLP